MLVQVREQEATVPLQDVQADRGRGQSSVVSHWSPVEDWEEPVQALAEQERVMVLLVPKWQVPSQLQNGKRTRQSWIQELPEAAQGVHISGMSMFEQSLLSLQVLPCDIEELESALGNLQQVVSSPHTFPCPLFVPPASPHSTLLIQVYPAGQREEEEEERQALSAHSCMIT